MADPVSIKTNHHYLGSLQKKEYTYKDIDLKLEGGQFENLIIPQEKKDI